MIRILPVLFLSLLVVSLARGQCKKVYESGVNSVDQQILINKHNALRLSLARGEVPNQPQACNMKRMHYDKQLAEAAQKLANTCRDEHVIDHDPRWWWVGQNLLMSMNPNFSKGADWDEAIQSWFDEHVDFIYPDNSKSITGHYEQVAWANTSYVGCGFISFDSNDDEFRYRKLYVCNYGPGGNTQGDAPYEISKNGQCGCSNLC